MSEIERIIHLIASMQILFGSRRGGWVVPLLLIALTVGGWCVYSQFMPPSTTHEKVHVMHDSSNTNEQIAAIKAYKNLLHRSDPLEPGRHWLRTDRDTLYRHVILLIHTHDFQINPETIPNYRSIHLSVL